MIKEDTTSIELDNLRGRMVEAEKKVANITAALEIAVTKANVMRQQELEKEIADIKSQMETKQAQTTNGRENKEKLAFLKRRLNNLSSDVEMRRIFRDWVQSTVKRIQFGKTIIKDGKDVKVMSIAFCTMPEVPIHMTVEQTPMWKPEDEWDSYQVLQ